MPDLPSQHLVGAPGIATWVLSAPDRLTVSGWNPDGSPSPIGFSTDTLIDPKPRSGDVTSREVVVAPDGRRVVVSECCLAPGTDRVRVFSADGTTLWTDPARDRPPHLAWSPNGGTLLLASQDAWRIVTFAPGGAPEVFDGPATPEMASPIGFSASGLQVYGWDAVGSADFWRTPWLAARDGSARAPILAFSGQSDPLGVSNGTTIATSIATGWATPRIDPGSGRVLDVGFDRGFFWELRDGARPEDARRLEFGPFRPNLAWSPTGDIVVADLNEDQWRDETHATPVARVASIAVVDPESLGVPIGPVFTLPAGPFGREFYGMRDRFALIGLIADDELHPLDEGPDEYVLLDIATGDAAVFIPADLGLTGAHFAGWVDVP
ncbi:MAG: hypothetical protein H0V73_09180 [Chloroflexi bacterium]|nr:hypothetical protein [Chloroflexota bacterium]